MDAAFLFNANEFKRHGNYAVAANTLLFRSGILQQSGRHMKMGRGDVIVDSARHFKAAFRQTGWYCINDWKLNKTFGEATVYAIVLQNVTLPIADALHKSLVRRKSYIGAMELDFSYGPHLVYFRTYIGSQYRIQGRLCRIFYSMSDRENSCFDSEVEEVRQYGFDDVDWEDRGAHGTVFDDYDTLQHFTQVNVFKSTLSQLLEGGNEGASELAFVIEDLSPRLFWTLAAAFERLSSGDNEEIVAQAALSGRRFLEQLADALSPPSDELLNGKRVGKAQYRNRLWAFISAHASGDPLVAQLGGEVDRLDKEFNGGLHGSRQGERLATAFVKLAVLTGAILQLSPEAARRPYYAHIERIVEIFSK